ncbi:MAG: acyl-CoA synthetase [Myxococcales bacterium]|nr:MAG: acyl-CoA synthetase [Myxococcales bacterium]
MFGKISAPRSRSSSARSGAMPSPRNRAPRGSRRRRSSERSLRSTPCTTQPAMEDAVAAWASKSARVSISIRCTWRTYRRPSVGQVNPCYELLDRVVIAGQADDPVLSDPEWSHARLLEDVAAVGGVLRAIEVAPGDPVALHLDDDLQAVVATLAVLRIGAVPTTEAAPVVFEPRDGVSHLVWSAESALDWTGVVKAGRTDPAPAYETPADHAAAHPDLRAVSVPVTAAQLRLLLLGA